MVSHLMIQVIADKLTLKTEYIYSTYKAALKVNPHIAISYANHKTQN